VKKILVIDDDIVMRTFVVHTLRKGGFQPIEATDGGAGIAISRQQRPDLIITDVVMEGMDGYKMLAAMREDPATATIPIILMTSVADPSGMRQGMGLGADDYLSKPVSAATLLSVVEVQLKKQAVIQERAEKSMRQLRSNLIRTLPHELNTPLNGILGCAEIMRLSADSLDSKEIIEMADCISVSANRLHRVARNYLAYARTEMLETDVLAAAQLKEYRTENALAMIDSVSRATAQACGRSNDLTVSSVGSGTLNIHQDDLRQIVDELAQNTCKFSKSGTPIRIAVTRTTTGFSISFTDQGRGIKPDQIGDIEAYSQFDRDVHAHEGLGLGLIISKRLARLYNGSFNVDSTPGVGTTVVVGLPGSA
jgi:two-component system, sensor histidine kinase and response regulator